MTAQSHEKLIMDGKPYSMATEPLSSYLTGLPVTPILMSPSSACWRGYVGTWQLKNDKLYLVGLKAWAAEYEERSLDYLFPGQQEIFADWFTGEIRLQEGKRLKYVHGGYASVYEKDHILQFEHGVLKSRNTVVNTVED